MLAITTFSLPTDAWAPASDISLPVPPSFPPALLRGWDQQSQWGCCGSCSGAPGTARLVSHQARTASTSLLTRSVQEQWQPGQLPRDSAMPGLRDKMQWSR